MAQETSTADPNGPTSSWGPMAFQHMTCHRITSSYIIIIIITIITIITIIIIIIISSHIRTHYNVHMDSC